MNSPKNACAKENTRIKTYEDTRLNCHGGGNAGQSCERVKYMAKDIIHVDEDKQAWNLGPYHENCLLHCEKCLPVIKKIKSLLNDGTNAITTCFTGSRVTLG